MAIIRKQNGSVHLTKTAASFLAENNNSQVGAYRAMAPMIGSTIVYEKNVHGTRVPRPIGSLISMPASYRLPTADYRDQHEACIAHLRAILKHDRPQPQQQQQQPTPQPEPEIIPEPQPEPPKQPENSSHEFLAWVERVQDYQRSNEIDPWGMRQAINGAKLISAGMPQEAIKDAFTIDFDDEARHVLGVRPFDLTAYGATIAEDGESAIEAVIGITMKAGVNACAVGGKGIGKTTTFEKIAEKQGATIAVISCSDDGIRPDLFGTLTPGINQGFVLAEVAEAMLKAEDGEKVFILLDEADALTPSDAIKLNRALEQRKITHPFLGRTIEFGKNVQFFAAMNTTGNGADEDYTGRDKQDSAFLDRFFRFRVTLDKELQRKLFSDLIAAA
jgi:hypothetical protein